MTVKEPEPIETEQETEDHRYYEEVEEEVLEELKRKSAIYDTLVEQEKKVAELAEDWADRKSEAAAAKGVHDTAVAELRRLIRAQNESNPLFDGPAPEPEAWREVRLDTLGFSSAILENLTEANLETIGQIADWTSSGSRLVNIAGVGPAAAEKIEDALEAFWKTQDQEQDTNPQEDTNAS
jgi:hypothetical protein